MLNFGIQVNMMAGEKKLVAGWDGAPMGEGRDKNPGVL
jgi:hypothetical protein